MLQSDLTKNAFTKFLISLKNFNENTSFRTMDLVSAMSTLNYEDFQHLTKKINFLFRSTNISLLRLVNSHINILYSETL